MILCTTFMILYSPIRLHFVWEDIFTTCFLHWILTCYSMELKNAGACIWISLQRFTLKYIMNTYDGKLYLESTLVSQTSGHFQLMFVTYIAVNVLKCTDIHVQAHNSILVIMVFCEMGVFSYALLLPGCLFTWIGSICYVGQYDLIAHIWSSVTPCIIMIEILPFIDIE